MCKSLCQNVRIHKNSIIDYCNNNFVIANYFRNRVNHLNCLRVIRTCKLITSSFTILSFRIPTIYVNAETHDFVCTIFKLQSQWFVPTQYYNILLWNGIRTIKLYFNEFIYERPVSTNPMCGAFPIKIIRLCIFVFTKS